MNKKVRIDGMLLATFLTTIFYSSTYPYIHKEIIMVVSDELIAINQIINCVSVIIFGTLWNKKSDKLFQHYPLLCVLEIIFGIVTTIFVVTTNSVTAYYILDTLVFAIITRNICCGGVKLRSIRYNSETKRECFDNNNNSASSLATIFGSVIAIFLKLDFNTMIFLATFGNIIDNIFYIFIYFNTKNIKMERGTQIS